jgi:hypothetical protein
MMNDFDSEEYLNSEYFDDACKDEGNTTEGGVMQYVYGAWNYVPSMPSIPFWNSSPSAAAPPIITEGDEDAESIQTVILNYKKVKKRYQANKHIIAKDDQYRNDLDETINYLSNLNKDWNDPYIVNWIKNLEQRKAVITQDLNVLMSSQRSFKEFALNSEEPEKNDVDVSVSCEICEDNKKDRALDCGHIFCEKCINKMKKCPICRIKIERSKIRPVYI